ncbi:hypothetical protein [Listeria costaricensis]|uniref:hypothetical protein n=1 Tax=Listeria costaricensis TaxID=2026604 RepID=UPI0013C41CEA|nr:hypothetical protein [Listeria costaricensis]
MKLLVNDLQYSIAERELFSELSFEARDGEFIVIRGQAGAGKVHCLISLQDL